VCVCTFNGSRFIRRPLGSVLPQLVNGGEVTIVDDASSDETCDILEEFVDERSRVLTHSHNLGVVKTFEHALEEASGDIIFLCDQDDIWLPNKVEKVMEIFETDPSITLVLTNGEMMDASGQPTGCMLHPRKHVPLGAVANLIRNRYQGSAMAFRRELLRAVLPFPDGIPMHDAWIGMVNSIVGRAAYIPDKLMLYRQHEHSVTKRTHGPVHRMVAQRWSLFINILRRLGLLLRVRRRLQEQPWTFDSLTTFSSR